MMQMTVTLRFDPLPGNLEKPQDMTRREWHSPHHVLGDTESYNSALFWKEVEEEKC